MNNSHLFSNTLFTSEDGLITKETNVYSISCFIRNSYTFNFYRNPMSPVVLSSFIGSKTGPKILGNLPNLTKT